MEQNIVSDEEIYQRCNEIIQYFCDYASEGNDPFGWDWPTMYLLFPEKCQQYDALKKEYLARKNRENLAAIQQINLVLN